MVMPNIPGGLELWLGAREILPNASLCLGGIPVATAALGPVAGLPAARLVASHFSVMTRNSQVLIAGPAVV